MKAISNPPAEGYRNFKWKYSAVTDFLDVNAEYHYYGYSSGYSHNLCYICNPSPENVQQIINQLQDYLDSKGISSESECKIIEYNFRSGL